jgi:hypothetical protein
MWSVKERNNHSLPRSRNILLLTDEDWIETVCMDIIQRPSRIEYRDLIDEGVTMSEWINSPINLRNIFGNGGPLR